MSAFGGKADIEAGSVKQRDQDPRQRAKAAFRASFFANRFGRYLREFAPPLRPILERKRVVKYPCTATLRT